MPVGRRRWGSAAAAADDQEAPWRPERARSVPGARLEVAVLVGRVVAVGVALIVALAGCAEPEYQFVGNGERDLVLRLPAGWGSVKPDEALTAMGQDPAMTPAWFAFYDSSARPDPTRFSARAQDAPYLILMSRDVEDAERPAVTSNFLRDRLSPVTAAARKQQAEQLAEAGASPPDFRLLMDRPLTSDTARGRSLRYSYTYSDGYTEVFAKIVLTDPDRSRIYAALLQCSLACFEQREVEIDQVMTSVTIKP